MSKRTLHTVYLLCLIVPLNESYRFFAVDNVNPWFSFDYPLSLQWYVKFLSACIVNIIKALIILRLSSAAFRPIAKAYLCFTGADLLFFLINFNHVDYFIPYLAVAVILLHETYIKGHKKLSV